VINERGVIPVLGGGSDFVCYLIGSGLSPCGIVRIESKKLSAAFLGRVFIWGRFLGTGKGWVAIANSL